jgi:hypothetical protein
MSAAKVYEDALWLPWIQSLTLHKPGDSFYRSTRCGIYVGKDTRARRTDAYDPDGRGFVLCPDCFAESGGDV